MIKLLQFPPYWGLTNASIFCMKLETFLRMNNIPFKTISIRNPNRSPKGQLPYIEDDSIVIADSGLIIEYLQKKYNLTLDSWLSPEQNAQALALRRMIEEHLYWVTIYIRWIDEHNWPTTLDTFFGKKRSFYINVIAKIVRNRERRRVHHVVGRHLHDEIIQMGLDDLKAIHTLIKAPFVFGEKATSIDAIVYAVLANIIEPPIESKLKEYAASQPKFIEYCQRMKQTYYSG